MRPILFIATLLGLGTYGNAQLAHGSVQYVPLNATDAPATAYHISVGQPPAPVPHPGVAAATAQAKLPPAATRKIDYVTDIHPILRTYCASCHLSGKQKGGLQLDTRESILKGGASGPAAVAGQSASSLMIHLVAGTDPDNVMPPNGKRLSAEQVGVLRAWIDQGLDFGKAASAAPSNYSAPLEPRHPVVPPALPGASANPLDRILSAYYKAHNIKPRPLVDDRTYARRVYLDLVGLLPTPEVVAAFVADKTSNKREVLARQLLSDNTNYAQHWLTFWNDALRNDYAGTGYIDGGRQQITGWLYNALLNDMPYDQFVSELVNPVNGAAGFTKGIVWRGTVNASQTVPMQAAQNISQVFLGVNLKCASCHDSFISNWKLADAYGMASIYADTPLEMVRCDVPQGKVAPIKFLYAALGNLDASADRPTRLKQLAAAITSKQDGRLTRTLVNRLWARLMGRGLIEPNDEMDNPPWNADLMDWLASDLTDNGFDVKKTLARIVTSQAYQLPATGGTTEPSLKFVFNGPLVKRMSAEQLADAVASLTGVWPNKQDAGIGPPNEVLPAKWIWNDPKAARGTSGGSVYLRKVIELPSKPTKAVAAVSCDNEFMLYVNGKQVAAGDDWQKPTPVDLAPYLIKGQNTLAVHAINWPDPSTGKGLQNNSPNPASLVFYAKVSGTDANGAEKITDFTTDASWLWSTTPTPGWEAANFAATGWQPAFEQPGAHGNADSLASTLRAAWQSPGTQPHIRAALLKADTLATALGRPNREQVVTARPSAATTLQALELTNGRTLASDLQQGANLWLATPTSSSHDLVTRMYLRALGRVPTATELQTATAIVGTPAKPEGVQDLLWILTMLPEFQLIY